MATIHFKIDPEDKQKIVDAADKTDRSLSNYCKFVLINVAEITKYGGGFALEKALKINGKE